MCLKNGFSILSSPKALKKSKIKGEITIKRISKEKREST